MSGAATAGMRGMNLLGCIFVGVLAATGGGTLRDLLLGQTPVFWLVEVRVRGAWIVLLFRGAGDWSVGRFALLRLVPCCDSLLAWTPG